MEQKKYELTDETIEHNGRTLYRIRAVRDFGNRYHWFVHKGDLGGFVESESNLSHKDLCWIFNDAKVYENAQVYFNAGIFDTAEVCGRAWVCGDSTIGDNAKVHGNVIIKDNAQVSGSVTVDYSMYNWDKVDSIDTLIQHYGTDHQILKAIEELNELAVALIHYRDGKANIDRVKFELADVELMVEQLKRILEIDDLDIDSVKKFKIQKAIDSILVDGARK